MRVLHHPMGSYETNCYIVKLPEGEIIIDPGMGATTWVLEQTSNPLAILNTHGHFDHIWSNGELQSKLRVPLFVPKDDLFMLEWNQFGIQPPPSRADVAVEPDTTYEIGSIKVTFWHFPGHTPGCSAIEIGDHLFTGDFLFKDSIGRVDFPYSDPKAMALSLKKFQGMFDDAMVLAPGHGGLSSVGRERRNIPHWLAWLR
ncbi:MAG: MBL fold metallo-hydrolase [Campylobacterales bacterium]